MLHDKLVLLMIQKKVAEPLNQVVNTIKTGPQSDADDLKNTLKKVEKAIAELNTLRDHLKVLVSGK